MTTGVELANFLHISCAKYFSNH